MSGSRWKSDESSPPMTIHRGTPREGSVNGAAAGDEVDNRLLPSLTSYRSVLNPGGLCYQWMDNGSFKEAHLVRSEASELLYPCGKDPRNYMVSPHMEQASHENIKFRQHLPPLSPKWHHPKPPGRHVMPTSPTFSEKSSIRLAPRSLAATESPCYNNGWHKTPMRSKTISTISSGVLQSSSDTSVSPLINSYSPYLNYNSQSPAGVVGHLKDNQPLESVICRWLDCGRVFEEQGDLVCL